MCICIYTCILAACTAIGYTLEVHFEGEANPSEMHLDPGEIAVRNLIKFPATRHSISNQ